MSPNPMGIFQASILPKKHSQVKKKQAFF